MASRTRAGIKSLTDVTENEIPKPVGCDCERHCLGANLEGENLAGDDPGNGSPCRGEEGNVEANKGYLCRLCRLLGLWDGRTYDGNDIFADGHANGTNEEQAATTKTLDTPNSREGHNDIDRGSYNRDDEGIADPSVGEESCAIIEDEIYSGKLLPSLEENTREGTEEDAIIRRSEAVKVGT